LDRSYLKKVRYAVQWSVLALVVYAGYRLYLFAAHFASGATAAGGLAGIGSRPPLVDGFLPIGALMALRLWVTEGFFDPVHPAALVILLAAIALALILKKSFCGWICPVGTISEAVHGAGRKLFGRNFALPHYVDYALRSVKYALLAFFLYVVFLRMSGAEARVFLGTPYWKVADVKMLEFFTGISGTTAAVLGGLTALSLLYKNFWCRYLCPYGALLGLLSYLSPLKITRNEEACVHCHRCTRNCPSGLAVEEKARVRSPECTGCLTCVSCCPARGALDVALSRGRPVRPLLYAALVAALFFGIIGGSQLSGKWRSNVTYDEYRALVPVASTFEHP
jgi:polyferredoxin